MSAAQKVLERIDELARAAYTHPPCIFVSPGFLSALVAQHDNMIRESEAVGSDGWASDWKFASPIGSTPLVVDPWVPPPGFYVLASWPTSAHFGAMPAINCHYCRKPAGECEFFIAHTIKAMEDGRR